MSWRRGTLGVLAGLGLVGLAFLPFSRIGTSAWESLELLLKLGRLQVTPGPVWVAVGWLMAHFVTVLVFGAAAATSGPVKRSRGWLVFIAGTSGLAVTWCVRYVKLADGLVPTPDEIVRAGPGGLLEVPIGLLVAVGVYLLAAVLGLSWLARPEGWRPPPGWTRLVRQDSRATSNVTRLH